MYWNRQNLLKWSVEHLAQAGVDHPQNDAEILISEVLGKRERINREEQPISKKEIDRFKHWVERRASREPIPYILKRCEFWSLEFQVTSKVLIPRLETEVLIEHFLKLRHNDSKSLRIMDLCTGSGIIAVVVAKEAFESQVLAVDISGEALKVAEKNAKTHKVFKRIHFLQSNLFKRVRKEERRSFDFILSNPPYINPELLQYLAPEMTQYEPDKAINGGKDGLKYYQSIIPKAVEFLKSGGYLILEFGFGLSDPIMQIMRENGEFEEPQMVRDFNDILRVVSARKI